MFDLVPPPYAGMLKFLLPLLALFIVRECVWQRGRSGEFFRGLLTFALLLVAGLSVNEYLRGNHHQGLWLNSYEFFHYYLGGKYSEELGYDRLYDAVLAADAEDVPHRMVDRVRDLRTGRIVPPARLMAERSAARERFSEARWEEFKRDVAFLRNRVPRAQWHQQLTDKGYNPTPAWTLAGGFLANRIPTNDARGMLGLVLIDVILLAIAFTAVGIAFGPNAALLLMVFLGTHYLMSHNTLRAAFLRMDWIACLVTAMALLRFKCHKTAGALAAWAAMTRVFPGIFAFGIGAKLLYTLLVHRRLDRPCLGFLAAFGVACGVIAAASALYTGGAGAWIEFFEKVSEHDDEIAPWRIGFKYIFLMTYETRHFWGVDAGTFFAENQTVWWTIQAAVLAVTFAAVGRLKDHEALAIGFVPAFFFFAPTYYYYVFLMLPILFFAGRPDQPRWNFGLALVFVSGILGHIHFDMWNRGFKLFFVMSCFMGIVALYMLAIAFLEYARPSASAAANDAEAGERGKLAPPGEDEALRTGP